jgi:hypothetical protein
VQLLKETCISRHYSEADSKLCLDLPSIVSAVVGDSLRALPEVNALVEKCRTLIEAARTKNAFR